MALEVSNGRSKGENGITMINQTQKLSIQNLEPVWSFVAVSASIEAVLFCITLSTRIRGLADAEAAEATAVATTEVPLQPISSLTDDVSAPIAAEEELPARATGEKLGALATGLTLDSVLVDECCWFCCCCCCCC